MAVDSMFQAASMLALAGWVSLLAAPWWPLLAERVAGLIVPLLLAVGYCGLILAFWTQAEGGFGSLAAVMQLFTQPQMVLAGWLHYLAFDLFVGAWEVRTARAERVAFLLVVPCLLLTFLFGPIGLLAFMTLRAAQRLTRPAVV